MVLCPIDNEKLFARQHSPLYDEALHSLADAHDRLVASPEYVAFEHQVIAFWRLLDETQEGPECNKPSLRKPVPDSTFSECFSRTEFILRCYRPLAQHTQNPQYQVFRGNNSEGSAAEQIVGQVDMALDEYRAFCGRSGKLEKRRYRALRELYIAQTYVHRREVMEREQMSDSELCFDIIIATARLTAILFGLTFPDDLTPSNLAKYRISAWIGRGGNQRHYAYSVF